MEEDRREQRNESGMPFVEPTIFCGESSDRLAQRMEEVEHSLKALFPDLNILRFNAGELLWHVGEPGDYVLNLLSETEHDNVILISGLEKLLLSKGAQGLFLELFFSWHAAGKVLQIASAVPLEDGLGWSEKLLKRLEWGKIVQV